jgi:hypothetical protein
MFLWPGLVTFAQAVNEHCSGESRVRDNGQNNPKKASGEFREKTQ